MFDAAGNRHSSLPASRERAGRNSSCPQYPQYHHADGNTSWKADTVSCRRRAQQTRTSTRLGRLRDLQRSVLSEPATPPDHTHLIRAVPGDSGCQPAERRKKRQFLRTKRQKKGNKLHPYLSARPASPGHSASLSINSLVLSLVSMVAKCS
jgi:hypothetical protein